MRSSNTLAAAAALAMAAASDVPIDFGNAVSISSKALGDE